MIVAECIVLACIFSYAYVSRLWNLMPKPSVKEENVTNPNLAVEDIHKMQGYWMIAIFGIDVGKGTSGARGNSSDVNIIACINQDTGDIKLVSLYRDTYLKVTDKGEYRKFNYAYSVGGPEMALKMLNENLDLNITDYIIFNWKAVADGINILGGVDVDITKSEFKFINSFITETVKETGVGSYQLKSAGMNHLDGIQAVSYARLRLMDNDYKRTERQRKIIELAFNKAKQSNYSVLNNILVVCLPQVMTNLDFVDLTNMALSISKYNLGETAGFPFEKSDANMGPQKGACVIPRSLESNVSQLHQFLFGDESYSPTSTVQQISQKIVSDTGLYANKSSGSSSSGSSSGSQSSSSTREWTDEDDDDEDETTRSSDRTIPVYPGIYETDEDGNLIDPPEPDDPYVRPGQTSPYETSPVPYPGYENSDGTRNPTQPSGTGRPSATNAPRWPGDTGAAQQPGGPGDSGYTDENSGPGSTNAAAPGGWETNAAAPGSVSPGGDGSTSPGGPNSVGGSPSPGGSGTAPGGNITPGGSGSPNPAGSNDAVVGPGVSSDSSGIITGPGMTEAGDAAAGPGY